MSSFLYGLGRGAYRRRLAVLLAWVGALLVLGAGAAVVNQGFDESFSVPGTESQAALDSLGRTFPQAGGTTAQLVLAVPEGASVRDAEVRDAIEASVDRLAEVEQVDSATSPFDRYARGVISETERAAITTIRFDAELEGISDGTYDALGAEARQLQGEVPGSTASVGGEAYGDGPPGVALTEGIGVLVALVVLCLTLGSLRAAGMPLVTALLGVALTMALIFGATSVATVSSTTPLLALMLGLAVGIDYALFLVSRHRDQLRDGMEPEESAARAVGTAGSAVVFAGLTVMIALAGLSVAGIPFLTTMGVAAAVGVGIAVLIALTLLPAMLGFAGSKLTPRPRPVRARRTRPAAAPGRLTRGRLARGWVRLVTRVPALTVLLVVAGIGAMSYPALDLRLALPTNGTAHVGTPARTTYDLVGEHFGVGYNGPLIVSATIVGSDDPLGVVDGIADELRDLPGVASVPVATPNEDADTAIIQVIPRTAPDSDETKALVREIRALAPHFADEYDVPTYVTGVTAVQIDISDRLGRALLPFGVLVVGLSLLLLTMVFRSVAVPLKATIGYLLSVGAAFGATAAVFEWGWLGWLFNVDQTGPVISFLPILLMGILFGLAMDYEVFLVSRMREEYMHSVRAGSARGAAARAAIEDGFVASSRVVVAAAVIMFAVFAAFVPEGEGAIKTIGFGLAIGVAVDAFVVRMTLVPAVLALLGRAAWWLPRAVDRRLPSFDVEGEGLTHQVALADWPAAGDPHLVSAEGVPVGPRTVDLAVLPREVVVVEGGAADTRALLLTLAGRMRLGESEPSSPRAERAKAKVAGQVLPEQAAAVRRRTGFVDASTGPVRPALAAIRRARPALVFVADADRLTTHDDRAALASLLEDVAVTDTSPAVVLGVADRTRVADLLPATARTVPLDPAADLFGAPAVTA